MPISLANNTWLPYNRFSFPRRGAAFNEPGCFYGSIQVAGKHGSIVHRPLDGRMWCFGGDFETFPGPDGWTGSWSGNGNMGMWSVDLALMDWRIEWPPNWATQGLAIPDGEVGPSVPDTCVMVYIPTSSANVALRDKFLIFPHFWFGDYQVLTTVVADAGNSPTQMRIGSIGRSAPDTRIPPHTITHAPSASTRSSYTLVDSFINFGVRITDGNPILFTSVTKDGNGVPTTTPTPHNMETGWTVYVQTTDVGVVPADNLTGQRFVITKVDATQFTLNGTFSGRIGGAVWALCYNQSLRISLSSALPVTPSAGDSVRIGIRSDRNVTARYDSLIFDPVLKRYSLSLWNFTTAYAFGGGDYGGDEGAEGGCYDAANESVYLFRDDELQVLPLTGPNQYTWLKRNISGAGGLGTAFVHWHKVAQDTVGNSSLGVPPAVYLLHYGAKRILRFVPGSNPMTGAITAMPAPPAAFQWADQGGYSVVSMSPFVWDPGNRVILWPVTWGILDDTWIRQMWAFHVDTQTWEQLSITQPSLPKLLHHDTVGFDPNNNVAIFMGQADDVGATFTTNPFGGTDRQNANFYLYRYAGGAALPPALRPSAVSLAVR